MRESVLQERDHSPLFTAGLTKYPRWFARPEQVQPFAASACPRSRLVGRSPLDMGLTHTSVKEPVPIRSGWGLIKVQSAPQIIYSATGGETLNVTYLKCPN